MKSILIVDDSALGRKLLTDMLTQAGYRSDEAGSGEEAIEKVAVGCFDLILLDVVMPGRNGLEIMPDLKRLSPGVKIIVITGFATVADAVTAIKGGASEYISKPFNIPEVLLIIQKVLEESALEQTIKKPEFDDTMAPLSNFIRRRIIMLLSSGKGHCLIKFQKELGIKDHTKILFHVRMLRNSGLMKRGAGKTYFLTKQGERALECLKTLEYYLKDE